MKREELEGLTKHELIDLVLAMQRPEKTSQTSSKPPSTDRKAKREGSRPGGAKPGHKGHARVLAEAPDAHEDHRPAQSHHCVLPFAEDASGAVIGEYDEIDLPEVKPMVRRHRRLKCRCANCGKTSAAPLPAAAQGTPFGHRIHALALYLKSNQLFSYERLQGALADLFGLQLSQGALMNMFKRTAPVFAAGRDDALRPCAALKSSPAMRRACGSRDAMRISGCSVRARPSSIPPSSAAPPRLCTIRWPDINPKYGYRIAILPSKGMASVTRRALLISIARRASSPRMAAI